MKLYCVKFRDGEDVIDVTHIVAKDNKEVHARLDKTLKSCASHGVERYNAYSFYEISKVEDFAIKLDKIESVFSTS